MLGTLTLARLLGEAAPHIPHALWEPLGAV